MQSKLLSALIVLCSTTAVSRSSAQAFTAPSFTRPAWTAVQQFTRPTSLRVLSNGAVLVADFDEPAVYLISPNGQGSRQIGRKGAGPREYLTPTFLIPLSGDSTLLIDPDADRYLIISQTGAIVATTPFPESMAMADQFVRGADQAGRLYFQARAYPAGPTAPRTTAVLRWDRKSIRFDSVAAVQLAQAVARSVNLGEDGRGTGMLRTPFTPADVWMVAPDASIAIVRATPYRIEWFKGPGLPAVVGATVPYTPVAVTDGDRKRTEPGGPPFRRTYPATKPAFSDDAVVLDDKARLWVGRSVLSGSPLREWDVFDSRAKHLGTVSVPSSKRIMAVSARFIYVLWTDDDDVQWLQAYAW